MPSTTLTLAASFVTAFAAASGTAVWLDDEDDHLDVVLTAGQEHQVTRATSSPVQVVEADYEMRNVGTSNAVVTLTLRGPDGAVLDTETRSVGVGQAVEVEVGKGFPGARGAAGTYTATLRVDGGTVHLTEGGVDINEDEDGEDE